MNNKVLIAFAMGTFIILTLVGYFLVNQEDEIVISSNTEDEPIKLVVYVVGEVESAGIFEVNDGTRVYEVIEMAGGATENADVSRLNLAKIVTDEEKIIVPKKITESQEEEDSSTMSNVVNINTANAEKLSTLSGIGKSTANKIIQYRNENGFFNTIEELMNVSGIGESKFNAIKNDITI